MADRIGDINKGEIILVDEKAALMKKLGKKTLTIHLVEPIEAGDPRLADLPFARSEDGRTLTFAFDASPGAGGPAALIRALIERGVAFNDIHTAQSSLEDIFVNLVRSGP
jgi:ABC-2 type transport system ATP-binding protein